MTVQELYNRLEKKVLILDGATGTELQKQGMPQGVCPEKWVLEHPQIIINVQKAYVEAGSEAVYACTFGANRIKLEEFQLQDQAYQINKEIAALTRQALGNNTLVIGDMAPTGQFVDPFGELKFEEAVSIYKEQAQGLYDGGVDLFCVETMIDIQELRAAIIAIKEICDLPIIASVTFSEDGYTLTGTDALSALITLQGLGAHVVGCNCSTGPQQMLKIIQKMKPYATVPLLAKPNAGLPKLINGKTVFDMTDIEFGNFAGEFISSGVNLYGGCCGTAPSYISQIAKKTAHLTPVMPLKNSLAAVSSPKKAVMLDLDTPLKVIGERINPTGKKKFQEKLRAGKLDDVKRFAIDQEKAGAHLLDVNMGTSGIDETEMMLKSIKILATSSNLPLVIDSSNPQVIEKALRYYPGRALINSISGEKHKLDRLLKTAAQYGAMFIVLPLTEDEIPATCEGRIKVIEQIYEQAQKYGLTKDHFVIDGLVMTVSSDPAAAKETLKLINWSKNQFKVNTVCGLSNVSFGLPQRKWINAGFLSMAMSQGLSMAIANPNEEILMIMKMASDVLTGNDSGCKTYIKEFSQAANLVIQKTNDSSHPQKKNALNNKEKNSYHCVIEGDDDLIIEKIDQALASGLTANQIVNEQLIPAINKVGSLYEDKTYFLPQLIASADTMKKAFQYLEPHLQKNDQSEKDKTKVILATVKGDIHDIGKNIVALMLKNYGFEVIDLGKDVAKEEIIDRAVEHDAKIIGLSALMTTTMVEMKNVIDYARQKKLLFKFMIGGAVINQEYADEIQADGYARDSIAAVKLARKLTAVSYTDVTSS